MATPVEITEVSQGRDAADNVTGERRYTRVFRVRYDIATPGPAQAIRDQLVKRYDSYVEPGGFADLQALATDGGSSPEDGENNFSHLVTIKYTTRWWDEAARGIQSGGIGATGPKPGGGGGEPDPTSPANPLARPPIYSWSFTTLSKVFDHDYDPAWNDGSGRTVNMVNGRSYDPPLMTERKLLTCTVERNTISFNPHDADAMNDTVNADDFRLGGRTWIAETVKCEHWTAKSEYENGIGFWAEHIVFIINRGVVLTNSDLGANQPTKWRRAMLQADTHELVGGKLKPIIPKGGHPIDRPWPLKTTGDAHPLTSAVAEADLYYRCFVEFPPKPFSVFGSL